MCYSVTVVLSVSKIHSIKSEKKLPKPPVFSILFCTYIQIRYGGAPCTLKTEFKKQSLVLCRWCKTLQISYSKDIFMEAVAAISTIF